ncbi:aminoacyl tRNA synthase complex-interacting multifunctional protein 2 isoform X3 [Procambarus clarkii]|uniref:aminoacyl tRNA synthase complex-interacting multifunctional protein 2 isoform X3 n=1 Tax=Procambarus clarkii TaxID=6728 RepID=UPI003744B148
MTTMYRMPRLVETPPTVELPSCMYKMEVLSCAQALDLGASYYGPSRVPSSEKNSDGVAALEVRQEALLERLQHLRQQLDHLLGNKVAATQVSSRSTFHPAIGAAAYSSPFKEDAATGVNCDVRRLQESVMYRLSCLKAELGHLSEAGASIHPSHEPIPLPEHQNCILKVIKALKEEVKFIAELQKKTYTKDWSTEVDVVTHHAQVVKKLNLLQEELAKMLRELQDLSWKVLPQDLGCQCDLSYQLPSLSSISSPLCFLEPPSATSVHDLVISGNPTTPPFSLVLLRKLLREAGCSVYSVNHVHSSVSEVSDYLQECFTDQPLVERSKHKVAFTLHWKDVSAPRLMVNPLHQTQISGEENIIRYVSRLFPLSSPFNYEASGSFAVITETDQLLDQVSKQVAAGNNKERQAAMRQLNGRFLLRLGKTEWLMGNLCGIADVLAWSLVKQAQLDVAAPANVAKWYKKMSTLAGLGT